MNHYAMFSGIYLELEPLKFLPMTYFDQGLFFVPFVMVDPSLPMTYIDQGLFFVPLVVSSSMLWSSLLVLWSSPWVLWSSLSMLWSSLLVLWSSPSVLCLCLFHRCQSL